MASIWMGVVSRVVDEFSYLCDRSINRQCEDGVILHDLLIRFFVHYPITLSGVPRNQAARKERSPFRLPRQRRLHKRIIA